MTTTLAPIGSLVRRHGEGWAVSARADIGTLPGCRLRRVIEHIQQNLDKDLTLAELAAVVYMSPYHFARLFKRTTGMPPHRFVSGDESNALAHVWRRLRFPLHKSRGWSGSAPRVTSAPCFAASRVSRREDIERELCEKTDPARRGGTDECH